MNVGASINTCCDKCKGICLNIESQFVKDALYAGKVLLSDNSLILTGIFFVQKNRC